MMRTPVVDEDDELGWGALLPPGGSGVIVLGWGGWGISSGVIGGVSVVDGAIRRFAARMMPCLGFSYARARKGLETWLGVA